MILQELAKTIAQSSLNEWVVHCLREVFGLPPIIQTIHILSVAIIMASSVMICLRILGLAVTSQKIDEMFQRLMPWTWWALAALFVTGMVFVVARPMRYFSNPVFGIKVALLIPVVLITLYFFIQNKRGKLLQQKVSQQKVQRQKIMHEGRDELLAPVSMPVKCLALLSLLLWIGIVLAGRWIAYAEYLFW